MFQMQYFHFDLAEKYFNIMAMYLRNLTLSFTFCTFLLNLEISRTNRNDDAKVVACKRIESYSSHMTFYHPITNI